MALSCCEACGILTGMEPLAPALVGRFLTSGPPGKSLFLFFIERKQRPERLNKLPDVAVWQKPTQHYKAVIFQFKKKKTGLEGLVDHFTKL